MSIVAIIPARGGSKRIPKKNIKPFAGLPIIAYSIRAAREAALFDRIIVSTDSDEIAGVAKNHGAEIPFKRPSELSDDVTGTDDVLTHALDWLHSHDSEVRYFCCIYATAPFLRPEDLRRGLKMLQQKQATTAFSVTTYASPIFRAFKLNDSERLEMLWPENFAKRSQEMPEIFHDAGQFYWGDTAKYLSGKRLFSPDSVPVAIPRYRVQDIDTAEDWDTAEKMFKAMEGRAY